MIVIGILGFMAAGMYNIMTMHTLLEVANVLMALTIVGGSISLLYFVVKHVPRLYPMICPLNVGVVHPEA